MCFSLAGNRSKDGFMAFPPGFKKPEKPIRAYKVLCLDRVPSPFFKRKIIYSPYFYFSWKKGLNVSSRTSTALDIYEEAMGRIDSGFHFWRSRKFAQDYVQILHSDGATKRYVQTFYINPNDIVAVNDTEIVATQATLK